MLPNAHQKSAGVEPLPIVSHLLPIAERAERLLIAAALLAVPLIPGRALLAFIGSMT